MTPDAVVMLLRTEPSTRIEQEAADIIERLMKELQAERDAVKVWAGSYYDRAPTVAHKAKGV